MSAGWGSWRTRRPADKSPQPRLLGSSPVSGVSPKTPFFSCLEEFPARGARPGVRRPPLDPRPGNLRAGSPIARAMGPPPDWGLRGGPPRPGSALARHLALIRSHKKNGNNPDYCGEGFPELGDGPLRRGQLGALCPGITFLSRAFAGRYPSLRGSRGREPRRRGRQKGAPPSRLPSRRNGTGRGARAFRPGARRRRRSFPS